MNEIIKLISAEGKKDEIGGYIEEESARTVFCTLTGVSGDEFFKASQLGLKADLRVIMWKKDYNGEKTAEYKSKRYEIYRIFVRSVDTVELFLAQRINE